MSATLIVQGDGDRDRIRRLPGQIEMSVVVEDDAPPRRVGWLIGSAGAGWAVVVMLGVLDPFQGDLFFRWLILGGSWLTAVLLGAPLWSRLPIPAQALGGGCAGRADQLAGRGRDRHPHGRSRALVVAGPGIESTRRPLVRPASRSRESRAGLCCGRHLGGRLGHIRRCGHAVLASEAAIAAAEEAINHLPPDYERAGRAYDTAIKADHYYARPWLGLGCP